MTNTLSAEIAATVTRTDSWVNLLTGLGTTRDKVTHTRMTPGERLGDGALESLFNDDDTARKIVSKLPQEALRRGYRIELEADNEVGEGDDEYAAAADAGDDDASGADVERELHDRLKLLQADARLRTGWIWARLYGGGSGLYVGAQDGRRPEEPLDETKISTVSFLNIVKRPQMVVKSRGLDVTQAGYDEPEIYTVYRTGISTAQRQTPDQLGTTVDVHASRLILFDGALTARNTQPSVTEWEDSVLQAAYGALQQSATGWQSLAHLMTDASQGVFHIANLLDLLAAGRMDELRTRLAAMDMARSVARAIPIDAEKEKFERVSTSFAGLPEVIDKIMMRIASAAEMPLTLLYGRSPAGMNATGESDIRGWYDTVSAAQEDILKPRLQRLITLLCLAKDGPTRGVVPERWDIKFNPLWQETDKECADTKKVKADTYVALVGAQILTETEAAIGLAPDFPVIDVAEREALRDKQLDVYAESLINPPDPLALAAADGGGGAKPDDDAPPKARGDAWSEAQPRDPVGRWTSTGRAVGDVSRRVRAQQAAAVRAKILKPHRAAYASARAAHASTPTAATAAALGRTADKLRATRRRLGAEYRPAQGVTATDRQGTRAFRTTTERQALLEPHRQALRDAAHAHKAAPTPATAAALRAASDRLRDERRRAGHVANPRQGAALLKDLHTELKSHRGTHLDAAARGEPSPVVRDIWRLESQIMQAHRQHGTRADFVAAGGALHAAATSDSVIRTHLVRELQTSGPLPTTKREARAAFRRAADAVDDDLLGGADSNTDALMTGHPRLPPKERRAVVRGFDRDARARLRDVHAGLLEAHLQQL
jgi:phage-related protein (TIGR01555 family)